MRIGNNDHGYNEFAAITKEKFVIMGPKWSLKYTNLHVYNKQTRPDPSMFVTIFFLQ